MRKLFLIIFPALALSACGDAAHTFNEINEQTAATKACTEFTRAQLAAPSSYKEVDVSHWNESLTGDQMKGVLEMWPEIGKRTPGLHMVGLEFDAMTEAGVLERGSYVCRFPTANGDILQAEIDGLNEAAEHLRAIMNDERTGYDFPVMKKPVA